MMVSSNLEGAQLSGANLSHANLRGANLTEVVLSGANLADVKGYASVYLKGATMPDGTIYP